MLCAASGNDAMHVQAVGLELPDPCVLYVFDAYCGWCWGVAPLMQELASAWTPNVPVLVVSGGLFVGPRAARIDSYPHIEGANRRITAMTGARFGERYQALLRDGSFMLDSLGAAAAFAALRAQAPSRAVGLAHRLQEAFYVHGHSPSDPATAIDIARQEGLDAGQVKQDLNSGQARAWAEKDFYAARSLGVNSYPSLLAMRSGRVTHVPCSDTPAATITAAVDWLVGEPSFAKFQRPK